MSIHTVGISKRTLKRGGTKATIRVEFSGKPDFVNLDDKAIAARYAEGVAEQVRANLQAGAGPTGVRMATISLGTAEWRQDEEAQGSLGGHPVKKTKDPKFVARAIKNYFRDYTAPRLGVFTPRAGGPRGIVSGMLLKSITARIDKSGKGATVYVASKRGRPRSGDSLSALETVFRGIPLWSSSAERQLHVQKGQAAIEKGMVASSVQRLLREATETVRRVSQVVGED